MKFFLIIGILIILLLLILIRSYYETHHFKIKRYTIKSDKIKNETAFAFITDLHNCNYGKDNETIVNAVKNENPDFLIIGGDLIVGKRNAEKNNPEKYFDNAVSFLKNISGEFPVLYTFGNHETRVKNKRKSNPVFDAYMGQIKELVDKQQIKLLNDDICNKNNIVVAGLEVNDEAYDDYNSFDKDKLDALMSRITGENTEDDNNFNILVSHTPEFFSTYAEENVDLILCGHNHGGGIRLPFIGGVISRDFKLFPRYSYGIYERNGRKMVLTGGLGDHTIHFRLFNMPEIVIITLKNSRD